MIFRTLIVLAALSLAAMTLAQETKAQKDKRMEWWREARFGMFIHWGTYSVLAGEYNGKKNYGEWIREEAHIPVKEYEKVKDRFNPVKFNAEKWISLAKEAGMKYVTITTKHHEGFDLFATKYGDYNVMNTPFKRDIMKELAAACAKQDIKMCWYHSIMDWHHPDYLPRRSWEINDRPVDGANMDRYEKYLHDQVTELLTNYGPIGVMWFDGEWESTWNHERGQRLYDLCRKLQPNVIVNNRVDVGRGGMGGMSDSGFAGDYGTPEQEIPATGVPGVDWETCMTMNDHWGYCKADLNFKSTDQIIHMLCDIASKGGNYLLNVGPTPEGEIPAESVQRLHEIGAWMKVNGSAIYDTHASVFKSLPWGRCTVKSAGGNTSLFLHVFDWPKNGSLTVPGIGNEVISARLLAGSKILSTKRSDNNLVIKVPSTAPDKIVSVIELKVKGAPIIYDAPEIVAESTQFVQPMTIKFQTGSKDVQIRYTTDGTNPTTESPTGTSFKVAKSMTVKARAFHKGKAVSGVTAKSFEHVTPWPKVKVSDNKGKVLLEPGLTVSVFNGKFDKMPIFETMKADETKSMNGFTISDDPNREWTARLYTGFFLVNEDQVYKFDLRSDDGSRLWIDGQLVVDNDGLHSPLEKSGVAPLASGWHHIRVEWFNASGGADLAVKMGAIGTPTRPIPPSNLMSKPK